MAELNIVKITTNKSDLKKFITFAWKIYKNDPNWVPPIIMDQMKRLDPKKEPYHQHSESQLFLAYRDGEIVGRISASIDKVYNDFHGEKTGFFGFFECINDFDVAKALFDHTREWVKQRGMTILRGPGNFTSNHEWSLLVEGFEEPPFIMMTYNPPYYIELIEKYGFTKAKDLYAFYLGTETKLDPRIISISEKVGKKHNIVMRTLNMKKYNDEVQHIKNIYQSAWEKNWGFVPLTDIEFEYMAQELKMVVIPELALMAEVNGEVVGFCVTIPDMNQALKKINGRLFPFGLLKLLYYKNKVDKLRLILLGIKEGYRKRGIDSLFYVETFRRAEEMGYQGGEISWTLEDNVLVNRAIESMGGKRSKTYRLYDINL